VLSGLALEANYQGSRPASLAALISFRRGIACLSASTSRIASIMKSSRKLFGAWPLKSAAPPN
jgi:hypothetical protein